MNGIKIYSNLVFIFVILFFANNAMSKNNEITEKEIERYNSDRVFIIKYSNIIYEKKGKILKIPIFQGIYGDVLYKNFRDYCLKMKYLEPKVRESGFIIKAKKGELRKTFHKFLNFYKSNILKDIDINKPAKMDCDGYEWWIDYDFIVDDVPCYIRIRIDSSEEDNNNYRKYKSPYEIKTLEKSSEPVFLFEIHVGAKSKK